MYAMQWLSNAVLLNTEDETQFQDKKLKSDICIMNSKPENIDEKANNKF